MTFKNIKYVIINVTIRLIVHLNIRLIKSSKRLK